MMLDEYQSELYIRHTTDVPNKLSSGQVIPATSRFISIEDANKQTIDVLRKLQADFKECIDGGEGSHDFELGVNAARNQAIEMIEDEINILRRQCR